MMRALFVIVIAVWTFSLVMDLLDHAWGDALRDALVIGFFVWIWPMSRRPRTGGAS